MIVTALPPQGGFVSFSPDVKVRTTGSLTQTISVTAGAQRHSITAPLVTLNPKALCSSPASVVSAKWIQHEDELPKNNENSSVLACTGYSVHMRLKEIKTAVGIMSQPSTAYMRTDPMPNGASFVSFGGAGWIHPKEIPTTKGYQAGHVVAVRINPSRDSLSFFVNDECVGNDVWHPQDNALPAISIDSGGVAELDVTFFVDQIQQSD